MKESLIYLLLLAIPFIAQTTAAQTKKEDIQFPEEFQDRVFEHILNIAETGIRSSGTAGEQLAANYVLKAFSNIDLETSVETFEFESFDIAEARLNINQRNTEVLQVCFNPYTATSFEFDENFVLLESDNTTTADVTNKIIVASSPLENNSFFSLFLRNPKLILVISSLDYQRINKEISRDLYLQIFGEIKKHQSQNVIGCIRTTDETLDEIIISAHYDSYPGSPGADDNASGVGALIELSKYFLEQKEKLTANLKFVAFGGEEKGLIGSRAYLDAHGDHISNCKLLVNMDQIGGESIFIETTDGVQGVPDTAGKTQFPEYIRNRSLEGIESNWRILAPEAIPLFSVSNRPLWLAEIIEESVEELAVSADLVGNTGSDQMTFAQAGIVSTAIGTSGNIYHSPLDIPSQINKQSLEECSKLVVKVVFKTMKKKSMI